MYKIIFAIISILTLLWITPVDAMLSTDFVNNEAPSAYFYPGEFDKLVLDLTIPSGIEGSEDKLLAITIKNTGNALDSSDIEKFKLWKDDDEPGFQGMGKDEELGVFTYYDSNTSWYLNNLNLVIPAEGLRIFISTEISKNAATNRSVQIKIPQLDDIDNDGNFDLADLGIFMESKNNGPSDGAVINSFSQTIKSFNNSRDNLAPKTVITDPEDNLTITTDNYTIKGMTRDQGGSSPAWVKIAINPSASSEQVVWREVNPTSSNYLTWEYQWQNIAEGNYTIKTQSADWIENTETEGDSVNVMVKFPIKEEPVSDEPSTGEEDKEESASAPDGATADKVEQLQEKIKEIQQQIIELLNQLIQIYLAELSSL